MIASRRVRVTYYADIDIRCPSDEAAREAVARIPREQLLPLLMLATVEFHGESPMSAQPLLQTVHSTEGEVIDVMPIYERLQELLKAPVTEERAAEAEVTP
jgi:hypothetical protein